MILICLANGLFIEKQKNYYFIKYVAGIKVVLVDFIVMLSNNKIYLPIGYIQAVRST